MFTVRGEKYGPVLLYNHKPVGHVNQKETGIGGWAVWESSCDSGRFDAGENGHSRYLTAK
jgi:hypothetical protein